MSLLLLLALRAMEAVPPLEPHCGAVVARLVAAPAVANTRHFTCVAGAMAML